MPFINGTYLITPQAVTTVNDSNFAPPTAQANLGLILIGPATDGEPNTPLTINGPQDAINQLKGGDGLQACLLAFKPSSEVSGVNSLTFIRPEQATQASSTIGTVIPLKTTSYGTLANLSKWMVSAGTVSGYKVQLGSDFIGPGGQTYPVVSQDNVGLNVLSLYYTGTGTSPTATVSDTTLTLAATGGAGLTITFTNTMTVQQVVNQINNTSGWVATVLDPNVSDLVSSLFDSVTSVSVGTTSATAVTLAANVTAVVRWINSTASYFTATRGTNPTAVPTSSAWTYATGGTTPTAANTDWQNAYTTAQTLNGMFVISPVAGSSAIWAMNDAHCAYMTGLGQWRQGYVGDLLGQTLATEITAAQGLNSCFSTLVYPGNKGTDYNGNSVTFAPYLMAAAVAGARAGNVPPNKLTQISFTSNGVEVVLTPGPNGTIAQANAAGIAALAPNSSGQVVLTWDRTTWLQDTKYDHVENLVRLEEGMIVATQNTILQKYAGSVVTPNLLGHVKGELLADLQNWYNAGILAVAPQASDITLTANGNMVSGSENLQIGVPGNYWVMTLYPTAYSGTV